MPVQVLVCSIPIANDVKPKMVDELVFNAFFPRHVRAAAAQHSRAGDSGILRGLRALSGLSQVFQDSPRWHRRGPRLPVHGRPGSLRTGEVLWL